ncbi:1-acyl-sn-glycerol-3-phosphate acyltransferase [Vibrio anguillarum]|nr:1-acyl-sn-glycerol-3-phosphate acyltransferase [Vibrio anguillarum]MBF4278214.1 1-acyl-sn-glycerol-3-phosphate acyltransferase [Vibrio anguillarum]MBF4298801.1 1-acyl-sn-glycerol-3-phosphate acyltransferase [Vibrio anguillarum]MBF4334926.1 1-acyl-sn-glycerol-3-phosphate acyltransferase [Vibrio anguillarum]MBF4362652.1 1-acyl-sn-glycerol-3-phosphate acyltransferase [Vibrio anguillarum]
MKPLGALVGWLIITAAKLVTGAKALGQVPKVDTKAKARVYFANHTSHGDFVLLWASLNPKLRSSVRPVAGADYWQSSKVRRFIIHQVFNGVLITRCKKSQSEHNEQVNPLQPMLNALSQGDSLILFPEGTRNLAEPMCMQSVTFAAELSTTPLLPFKAGLFHLLQQHPQVECVPVWITNVNRVMPKGRSLPLPLLCTVNFGEPILYDGDEDKAAFLARAQLALLDQAPGEAQ